MPRTFISNIFNAYIYGNVVKFTTTTAQLLLYHYYILQKIVKTVKDTVQIADTVICDGGSPVTHGGAQTGTGYRPRPCAENSVLPAAGRSSSPAGYDRERAEADLQSGAADLVRLRASPTSPTPTWWAAEVRPPAGPRPTRPPFTRPARSDIPTIPRSPGSR